MTSTFFGLDEIRSSTKVPIYDAHLELIVSKDIQYERRVRSEIYGPAPTGLYYGLCSWTNNRFALFYDIKEFKLHAGTIAHEIFHLTHRIMEWSNVPFSTENHEPFALLNGWLTEWVKSKLEAKP